MPKKKPNINETKKKALKEQALIGKVSEILLNTSDLDIAAKKIVREIVTKDVGLNVNTTFSADPSSSQLGAVTIPSDSSSSGNIMYWPSSATFYQQGKDLAKKAYNEYLNSVNQYLNSTPEQYDQKMQQAGKMNSTIQSFVQGINIGTDAAENIDKRIRTGDQAALIEIEAVKDTLSKMLKTIWVHNTVAKTGKHVGLEVKLIDPQLATRLNQATKLETTDYGIPLGNDAEADTIWVDATMPSETAPITTEQPVSDEEGSPDIATEEIVPPEEGADLVEQPLKTDELPVDTGEEIPVEAEEEAPIEEELPTEEELTEDLSSKKVEGDPQFATFDQLKNEGEAPIEEETPIEETVSEEMPIESEEDIPIKEEVSVDEEEITEEVDEDGLPLPTGPEGTYTKEDLLKYGDMLTESLSSEEEEGISTDEEEMPNEEEEESTDEESSVDEEEESVYCIVCDQEVTPDEIEMCEREDCPFKKDIPLEDEEEEETEDELPVEMEDEEELPVEIDEEDEKKKGLELETKPEKHYIMMDHKDHSDHNVKEIIVKEFTGLEGEYCLDCQKTISFSFEQKTWSSEDARSWISKHIKSNEIKNKSSEEIILENLDKIPETVLKEWVETKKDEEVVEEKLDVSIEDIEKMLTGGAIEKMLENVFEPIKLKLKNLEA